jgi:two-component system, NtrC family, sensor kinase
VKRTDVKPWNTVGFTHPTKMTKSIVGKLTLFVGVLVAFNTALLVGAAYVTTSSILSHQVRDRLMTIASDRQEILFLALRQQRDRAASIGGRTWIRRLFTEHAGGTLRSERFADLAGEFLANVQTHAADLLAAWIEDDSGLILAGSDPRGMVAGLARAERPAADPKAEAWLAVPPRRVAQTYAVVFGSAIRDDAGRSLGTVMLAADFGPVMTFLGDTHGLDESGEVLVGWRSGDRIHLPLPPRGDVNLAEVSAEEFPSLAAASSGENGFRQTTDYRGREVLVAYRPVGVDYPNWGLIAKLDSDEAYGPVARLRRGLLALGGVMLVLGLGASNAIARRVARPIKRLARTSAAVAAGDLTVRSAVESADEIGGLSLAFNRMTEELERSYATLERRIAERTHALEAVRDLLDAFFRISTSRLDPDNIDKTFDAVLRFCSDLGYDLAMISLVDREAGVIRAVRASGRMAEVVGMTVRALNGGDILAIAVREGRAIIVPDSTADSRCDVEAVARSGIRGQIVLPMVSDEVLGTLQVASCSELDEARLDLRPLETLASHAARALAGLRQLEEIRRLNQSLCEHTQELARSELAVREQTRILQSVLDCMGDGVVVADAQGQFLVFNPAARRILGRDRIDVPSAEWSRRYELYLPDRLTPYPTTDLPLLRAMRGESVDQAELYIAYPSREDGTWITATGRPLADEQGTIEGGVVVFQDITRRKKGERRLAAQYETTRVLSEADSLAQAGPRILETVGTNLDWDFGVLWLVDSRSQRLRCKTLWIRPGLELSGFADVTRQIAIERGARLPGRAWAEAAPEWIPDITGEEQLLRRSAALTSGLHAGFAVPILLQGECLGVLEFFSGEVRPVDRAALDMMASLGSQIGQFIERRQMRARVVQSERLASLGLLSAGVAHEINNPLAYVANNLAVLDRDSRFLLDLLALYERGRPELEAARPELVRRADELADDFDLAYVKEHLGQLLDSTRQGVKRVADIVHNLRGFARADRAGDQQADVHEAIRAALEMIRGRLVRRGIAVEERFGEVPVVAGSPAQLNQVFLNLLINALQAIEETHRADGRIAITTGAADGEVSVEVADNGCGIRDDVLPHIFDPFFTTKGVGDGTGLGLSITHGMVQDNGGRLEVDSTSGQGTRFRVILAAAERG